MPVIKMYRDGEVAVVDSDHTPTYENFLAHGWKLNEDEAPASPPVFEAVEVSEAPAPAPQAAPAPRGRKAR